MLNTARATTYEYGANSANRTPEGYPAYVYTDAFSVCTLESCERIHSYKLEHNECIRFELSRRGPVDNLEECRLSM